MGLLVDRPLIQRKIAKVEDYLRLIKGKKDPGPTLFGEDRDLQSIIIFNLIQAIQSCIDIGTHIISDSGWEMPGTQAGIFETLADKKVIGRPLSKKMIRMVGFRNRIVHEYEKIDFRIVHEVWRKHVKDIEMFCRAVGERYGVKEKIRR